MSRATLPLNSQACSAADEQIYAAHANDPRPNALYDANGNRLLLDADDPSQEALRAEWMDYYEANGGEVEGEDSGGSTDDPVETCPYENAPADPTKAHIFVTAHMPDGTAIPGADVYIDSAFVGLTDTNGFFDHGDVEPGTYEASISKAGYTGVHDYESASIAAGNSYTYPLTLKKAAKSCGITTQTVATHPTDRARRRIGITEKVEITVACKNGNWSVTGPGTLDQSTGKKVTLTASDYAGRVFVTVKGSDGCESMVDFEVVEPSGVKMVRQYDVGHTRGQPSVELWAEIHILPDDVSFKDVLFEEGECQANLTGYFAQLNNLPKSTRDGYTIHPATGTPFYGEKYGTFTDWDSIIMNDNDIGTPHSHGTFIWPIPWRYSLDGYSWKEFAIVEQAKIITPTGKLTVLKAGVSEAKELNDPTVVRPN